MRRVEEWSVEKYTGYAKVKKDRVEKRRGYAKVAKPRSVWKSFSGVCQNCKHFAKIANPTLPKLQTLGKIGIHTEIYLKLLRVYTELYLNLLRKRRQSQRASRMSACACLSVCHSLIIIND